MAWRELGRGDGLAGSVRARAARARACGVRGGQFPCPGGAVLCWERQGAALGLGGRLRCHLRVGDRGGMATVRRAPWVAMITTAARVFPVPNWRAGQVRGVEKRGEVQGIDEQTHESVDLIRQSPVLGKNRVVPTTCSIKFPNQI